MGKLNVEDKIIRAKVDLQAEAPFWAYLIMHLETKAEPGIMTAGVRQNSRYIYYEPNWIDQLTLPEVKGVLGHEIGHVSLGHLDRIGNRVPIIWNHATDLWINAVLIQNGFTIPKCALIPVDDKYTIGKVTIDKISERFAEEIYDLIKGEYKVITIALKGFDNHEQWGKNDKPKKGDGGGSQKTDQKINWPAVMAGAAQYAKQQGKIPASLERWVNAVCGRRIGWRNLLQSIIVQSIPCDYTFKRPSRHSPQVGIYLPSTKKEKLELSAVIDSSGSISQDALAEFKGLLISLIRTFSNVRVHVIVNDAEVHDHFELTNATVGKFKMMKVHGGGGTNFIPAFEAIAKERPHTQVIVFLTDGYGTFPEQSPASKVIWMLQPPHCNAEAVPFGKVILLEKYPINGGRTR